MTGLNDKNNMPLHSGAERLRTKEPTEKKNQKRVKRDSMPREMVDDPHLQSSKDEELCGNGFYKELFLFSDFFHSINHT